MDENTLKFMNKESLELRQMRRIAEQRLADDKRELQITRKAFKDKPIHSFDGQVLSINQPISKDDLSKATLDNQKSFEALLRNMQAMEERMTRELEKLKK